MSPRTPERAASPAAQRPLPLVPIAIGVVVLLAGIGVLIALVGGGGDDGGGGGGGGGGDAAITAGDEAAADDQTADETTDETTDEGASASNVPESLDDLVAIGPVTTTGDPLPKLSGGSDAGVGMTAPVLEGYTPDRDTITVGPGEPTLVVFLAHWCPHCQAELPRLVDLAADGGFDGIRTVAVLTGTNPDAPNYPPAPWLYREGWTGEAMVDTEEYDAAAAFGLAGYPFMVMLAADGTVVARSSGELPMEDVQAMIALAEGG